jgi:electron transfer flavoprotein beta subunit
MKIVVLQELSAEVALAEQAVGVRDERQANAGRAPDDWRITRVDAADSRALGLAVGLKVDRAGVDATLLHLGPKDAEDWMREQAARGCDVAVRVWDDDLALAGTQVKALVLAAAVRTLDADLVLTGDENATSAGGQLGVLIARHLGIPCVTRASHVGYASDGGHDRDCRTPMLHITRELARGYRERVALTLPAVVTVAPGDIAEESASIPALLHAFENDVPVWDLAALGVPAAELRRIAGRLRARGLSAARPPLKPVPAPDATAPAFERVMQLVAGSVKRRAGRVVRGTDDEIAGEVFEHLLREGWLDHLRGSRGDG